MNKIKVLSLLLLLTCMNTVMARELHKCQKIRFSNYTPKHKSEAASGSDFSFTASEAALPNSIRVKVKKIEIPIKVEKKGKFYKVTGQLPPELENTFARISVVGNAVMECETKGGWLLNITGPAGTADKQADNDQTADILKTVTETLEATQTVLEKSID